MRERNGGDDRDQKDHRRDLERESVIGVNLSSQGAGIAVAGPGLAGHRPSEPASTGLIGSGY